MSYSFYRGCSSLYSFYDFTLMSVFQIRFFSDSQSFFVSEQRMLLRMLFSSLPKLFSSLFALFYSFSPLSSLLKLSSFILPLLFDFPSASLSFNSLMYCLNSSLQTFSAIICAKNYFLFGQRMALLSLTLSRLLWQWPFLSLSYRQQKAVRVCGQLDLKDGDLCQCYSIYNNYQIAQVLLRSNRGFQMMIKRDYLQRVTIQVSSSIRLSFLSIWAAVFS